MASTLVRYTTDRYTERDVEVAARDGDAGSNSSAGSAGSIGSAGSNGSAGSTASSPSKPARRHRTRSKHIDAVTEGGLLVLLEGTADVTMTSPPLGEAGARDSVHSGPSDGGSSTATASGLATAFRPKTATVNRLPNNGGGSGSGRDGEGGASGGGGSGGGAGGTGGSHSDAKRTNSGANWWAAWRRREEDGGQTAAAHDAVARRRMTKAKQDSAIDRKKAVGPGWVGYCAPVDAEGNGSKQSDLGIPVSS